MKIEDAYRLLELKPGATLKEVVEARDDLLALWNPERLSHHPRLRSKAAAKLREIQDAYSTLMEHLGETGSRRAVGDSAAEGAPAGVSGRSSASLYDEVFSQRSAGGRFRIPLWAVVVLATGLATGVYFLGTAATNRAAPAPEARTDAVAAGEESTAAPNQPEGGDGGETPALVGEEPQTQVEPSETRPAAVPAPEAPPPQRPVSKTPAAQPPSSRRPVLVRRDAEPLPKAAPEEPLPVETQNTESQRRAYLSLLANSATASRLVRGDFEDLRFLEWKVVREEGGEVWIDLLSERKNGDAVHFIWSVNAAASTVRPLSHAARELERGGGVS